MSSEDLVARLEELERRIASLESSRSTLQIPVRVVDDDGAVRVEFSVESSFTGMTVLTKDGKRLATLGEDGTGNPSLVFWNSDGKIVGYLDVESWGGRLVVQGNRENGGVILFGGSCDDEGAGIHVVSTEERGLISLWSGKGSSTIAIEDSQTGKAVVAVSSSRDGGVIELSAAGSIDATILHAPFPMVANTPQKVSALVDAELQQMTDGDGRAVLAAARIEPLLHERMWEYGHPPVPYPCWLIARFPDRHMGIAYCEYGHGRNWGAVDLGSDFIGPDACWADSLELVLSAHFRPFSR